MEAVKMLHEIHVFRVISRLFQYNECSAQLISHKIIEIAEKILARIIHADYSMPFVRVMMYISLG